jgi:hypothetical protein
VSAAPAAQKLPVVPTAELESKESMAAQSRGHAMSVMGWKDLFKGKAPKAEPDPRLRWFGKLPTYADYYTSATDEEWAVEFNDWILKGFELYMSRGREGARVPRLPSAACILRLSKTPMTVFASVQDYGGDMRGRPFPLCFYVGLPSLDWPGPTSDRALAGLRVLYELTELRDRVIRFFNSPGRFDTAFGGREISLAGLSDQTGDLAWVAAARSLSLADWFQAVRPCLKADDLDSWCRTTAAWGENIAKLDSEDFGPTLRFPLVMTIPLEVQAAGWLRWLERHMDLKERLLSLVVSKDASGETGRLTVVAREVVPEDFLLMTSLAGSLSYVDDLCALAEVGAHDSQATASGVSDAGPVRAPEYWADFVHVSGKA